jgi:hypothetical protein
MKLFHSDILSPNEYRISKWRFVSSNKPQPTTSGSLTFWRGSTLALITLRLHPALHAIYSNGSDVKKNYFRSVKSSLFLFSKEDFVGCVRAVRASKNGGHLVSSSLRRSKAIISIGASWAAPELPPAAHDVTQVPKQ